ncbi:MAG TPA: hypothetical protein VFZ81_07295 [Burkholderiales bacterium]
MKKALITAAVLTALTASARAQAKDTVLEFNTMAGVSGPFVGPANPIRGLGGGGIPWRLQAAKGELRQDGRLEVRVRGLVLAAGPNEGTNPVANFRAVVSCRVIDGMNNPAILNLTTGDFPANSLGDSDIEATLELPNQCFAPIIFVTNPQGRWFSVTGF